MSSAIFSFLQDLRLIEFALWAIVPFFFFGLIIAFMVAMFIMQRKQRQKRIQNLQSFAAQDGWTFVPNATRHIFQNAHAYSLLNYDSGSVIALMHKPHDGGTVLIFDYSYTVGSGKNSTTHTQTVVAFQTPHLMIPYFALYPESFFSFIGEMFGFSDIDFHTHPVFSKNFKLTGREEMPICPGSSARMHRGDEKKATRSNSVRIYQSSF